MQTQEIQDQGYSRPNARFDANGRLEIRASANGNCRRALWYTAMQYPETNPTPNEQLIVMECGNALEPVVVRAMQRDGWEVTPADTEDPDQYLVLEFTTAIRVTGHYDAKGFIPVIGDEEVVIEIKSRGSDEFKRWEKLGAERSHPEAVAQAAIYTHALFDESRDVVIATMNTDTRQWDYEIIPAERVGRALERARHWLSGLEDHFAEYGVEDDYPPARDFAQNHWRCLRCEFRDLCRPPALDSPEPMPLEVAPPEPEVPQEAALEALSLYEDMHELIKAREEDKKLASEVLSAWLAQQPEDKATLQGRNKKRTLSMVHKTNYSVNLKKLNQLLGPEEREEIVSEKNSEYLRVG